MKKKKLEDVYRLIRGKWEIFLDGFRQARRSNRVLNPYHSPIPLQCPLDLGCCWLSF
jgi:hypothetical protein